MHHTRGQDAIQLSTSDTSLPIAQNDIAQIRESIQDAQYFDHTSMAALTPASLVSV